MKIDKMVTSYGIFTSVRFVHEYNTDASFIFLNPMISSSDAIKLRNWGMIFKKYANGFDISFDYKSILDDYKNGLREAERKRLLADTANKLTEDMASRQSEKLAIDISKEESIKLCREKILNENFSFISTNKSIQNIANDQAAIDKELILGINELLDRITVTIELRLTDYNFFNYTGNNDDADNNLFANISGSIFYFTNTNSKEIDSDSAYLHNDQFVNIRDLRLLTSIDLNKTKITGEYEKVINDFNATTQYPNSFFSKPFGLIRLKLLPGLKSNYQIHFDSRKSFWKYIIQTKDLSQQLNDMLDEDRLPAILNKDDKNVFSIPIRTDIAGGKKAIVFTSLMAMNANANTNEALKLVEREDKPGNAIIDHLPMPDYSTVSRVGIEKTTKIYSEIFL